MSILDRFCDALRQAMTQYETEVGGQVPNKRRSTVDSLRQLIRRRQAEQLDAFRFRQEIVAYVAAMPVRHFLFISLESRLAKRLRFVLEQPDFSEVQLLADGFTEMRVSHKTELSILQRQVVELTQLLANEQTKDNVQLVNTLLLELSHEKKENTLLVKENQQLTQENQALLADKITLQENYKTLELKYEALLQEKQLPVKSNTPLKTAFFN